MKAGVQVNDIKVKRNLYQIWISDQRSSGKWMAFEMERILNYKHLNHGRSGFFIRDKSQAVTNSSVQP